MGSRGPDALQREEAKILAEEIALTKEIETAEAEVAEQITTESNLENFYEEAVNPLAGKFAQDQRNIKERPVRPPAREEIVRELHKIVVPDREVRDQLTKFEHRNPELKAPVLKLLLDKAKECRTKEDLLLLINEFYPDPSLADDALEFLLATTLGELKQLVRQAQASLHKETGREIQAGKNISAEVEQYVSLGLGAPSKLRDIYRDITGNPREPITLFLELGDRFTYKEMRKVLAYLFHALGSDLKSQGPSIPPGLLHRLLSEVRNLQAGLGILRFFKNRMKLIGFLFQRNAIPIPEQLNFETIARQFVVLLQERYPSAEGVLQLAQKLGISADILAKIIIFSQMRDAVREIALYHFYRSLQHRDEIYKAILAALEQLEEELDELLEKEYEEEEEGEEKGEEESEEESEEEQES